MTKLKREASAAVKAWAESKGLKLISKPRHVYPRAFVVGYAAPLCLIVSVPWQDAEPQCRDFDRRNPLKTIHTFDASLKAGDWCAVAYVCASGRQECIAVPFGEVQA